MKRVFGAIIIVVILASIVAILNIGQKPKVKTTKITIVTTLFPLYDFAKMIGKDKVSVVLLVPPGVEPHAFEPRPSDIATINRADLFIYTGKFMEPWAEDVAKSVVNKHIKIVDASKGIALIPSVFRNSGEPAGSLDPHIWLDFANDKIIIQTITTVLSQKDPANANYYLQNASQYQDLLSVLDTKYKSTLSQCKSNDVIYGGHYAFGYLANRYNLNYYAAQGISPDAEPSAKDLVQLVEQINSQNIQYIFYEELTTSKIAETIANETKAKLLPLNASHNLTKVDFDNNVSFMSIMEKNLVNLAIGLQCSN